MPRKPKSKPKKKKSVTIIAGWIMGGAAIIAAIIGIFPSVLDLDAENKNPNTATTTTFSKYDDPYDMFSIEYPSGLVVLTREDEADGSFVTIGAKDTLELQLFDQGGEILGILVKLSDKSSAEINDGHKYVTDFFLQGDFGDLNSTLVSTEKTEKGFLTHSQFTSDAPQAKGEVINAFCLVEIENFAFVAVIYIVHDENSNSNRNIIDYIFSSFSWSATNINEFFNP